MAVTPVGNPYVESSDLVANYPGASEALAERIDIVGVNPFADSAARATAIPSPTEGMMSSLNDTNAVERYDGATWKPVGGKVLQVVSVAKTDTFSTSSLSFVDVTDLSVSITPSATSSKILVFVQSNGSTTAGNSFVFRLLRDATPIAIGDAASSRARASSASRSADTSTAIPSSTIFLDAPNTTSAVTYKSQILVQGGTVFVNRNANDADAVSQARTISTITVMEIGA